MTPLRGSILHAETHTLGRADPRHQSPTWTSAGHMGHKARQFSDAIRPTRIWLSDRGRPIAKGPTGAIQIHTSPSRKLQSEPDRCSLSQQVLQMADIPAVPSGRLRVTCWTTTAIHQGRRHSPTAVHLLDSRYTDFRDWRPFRSGFHQISLHRPPRSANRLTHDAGDHTV
jgi:hypothetical protein